jgi:outer membrane protein assembly factor BamB
LRLANATPAFVVAVLVAVALASTGDSAISPDTSWTSFGHDAQIDAFTPAAAYTAGVKGFKIAWQAALDGGIVASPVAAPVAGQGIVVFATTTTGNAYALKPSGAVLWHRSLGTVSANGNCGTYGVDSTGAIDEKRGLFYVVGATGMLHALRLSDGSEAPGWPIQAVTRRRTEYVWGGLRLADSRLYVPVASYCDAPDRRGTPAEGRLLAYDVDNPSAPPAVYDPVPGADNLGGIWGGGGVSLTFAGTELYTGIGNASPDVDDGSSDSMVELTPDLSEVVASDRPSSAAPGDDTDLGAAPVLFHPRGCPALLAANSKSGELLVWRQDRLTRGPFASIPLSDGVSAFVGAPSWSPRTQMLYDAGATALRSGKRLVGTIALKVTTPCGFEQQWFVATGTGAQPEPLVAGDLVASTGGFGGGFVVARASSGVVVWRFPTSSATLSPLIEAGGELIAGDMDGHLYAFRPRL